METLNNKFGISKYRSNLDHAKLFMYLPQRAITQIIDLIIVMYSIPTGVEVIKKEKSPLSKHGIIEIVYTINVHCRTSKCINDFISEDVIRTVYESL